jgi:hydrocephalus-inducing protein
VQLDLVFEPSKIGEFQTTLVISSPVGGDYAFPLTCSCTPPKPQGPFMVKVGAPTIMFKNVTNSTVAFSFVIDNPSFTVKSAETLGPKKTAPIMIAFKANSPKTQKTARMTVTHPNGITWVYYLKAQ